MIDYKEKYEQAIERLKQWDREHPNGYAISERDEFIFPELKESEDERIRKELIDFVKSRLAGFPQCEKFIAWIEKQGKQKPADKVEPKFKVGDWVVSPNGVYWHIDAVKERYKVSANTGECADWPLNTSIYRLWTIQDAKDGDVLADRDRAILLFRGVGNNERPDAIDYYALLETNMNNRFSLQEGDEYWGKVNSCSLCPATKEQRDTLMKAMADAGYTFDFEKKELKKIKQKPTEWSKEDETMLNCCLGAVNTTNYFDEDNKDKMKNWLMFIKERVQPKQEWSEEDEKTIDEAVEYIEKYAEYVQGGYSKRYVLDLARRIESFIPQHRWKPSDIELEVLRLAAEKDGVCLMKLYEQLKKLREE